MNISVRVCIIFLKIKNVCLSVQFPVAPLYHVSVACSCLLNTPYSCIKVLHPIADCHPTESVANITSELRFSYPYLRKKSLYFISRTFSNKTCLFSEISKGKNAFHYRGLLARTIVYFRSWVNMIFFIYIYFNNDFFLRISRHTYCINV